MPIFFVFQQSIVAVQILYQWLKDNMLQICSGFETCNDVVGVIFGR